MKNKQKVLQILKILAIHGSSVVIEYISLSCLWDCILMAYINQFFPECNYSFSDAKMPFNCFLTSLMTVMELNTSYNTF